MSEAGARWSEVYGEQLLMKVCEALRHPPALPRGQNKQVVIL